jgi:glutathione S-transferase
MIQSAWQNLGGTYTLPKLHHFILDPQCRRMRLALGEYGVLARLVDEKPWAPSDALLQLNPAGHVPVFIEDTGHVISGVEALSEYLEETRSVHVHLIPGHPVERAEVRRLVSWFDIKFFSEVTEPILSEKIIKRFAGSSAGPEAARIRRARELMKGHLEYIALLAEERTWLAGEHLSLADLAAAAHLSTIDYLGDVPWADNPVAQVWYSRVKSRPAFRTLLQDTISGISPAAHYADLDF